CAGYAPWLPTYQPWVLLAPIATMRTGAALAAMDPHKNVEKDNKIAPPSSVMNSRLLARNSIRKRFGINGAPVSSTPVRSAHGNSFNHLVGAQQEGLRDREPERLDGCQIDDEIEFSRLLDR